MKIGENIVQNMMEFAQYWVILQEENFIIQKGRVEDLNDHDILPTQVVVRCMTNPSVGNQ